MMGESPAPGWGLGDEVLAVVEAGRVTLIRGRAARMILWLAENQELINPEPRGRLAFPFAGRSLKVEVNLLRDL